MVQDKAKQEAGQQEETQPEESCQAEDVAA